MQHFGTQEQISGEEYCERLGEIVDAARDYCDSQPINIDSIISSHEETQKWFDYYVAYLKMDVWASFDKQSYYVGETVKWRTVATNTCDTALPGSSVSMSVKSADNVEHGAAAYKVDLAPGASTVKEGSWTATTAQIGTMTATETVTVFNGKTFSSNVATARIEAYNPDFTIEIRVVSSPPNGSFYTDGDTIRYEYVIRNTGNVPLDDTTVKITITGNVNGANKTMSSFDAIQPGAEIRFTDEYVVTSSNAGYDIKCTATVTSKGVTRTASAPVISTGKYKIEASMTRSGTATGLNGAYTVGDTIVYTITVRNTGTADLNNVEVTTDFGSLS